MPASAHKDRIRDSWQRGGLEGTRARVWLIVRRTTATLLVVGLVSYCAYLLWVLLWNPNTYYIHLTASTYRPSGGQPVQFAYGDFAAFKRLAPAFASESFPESLERPLTVAKLQEKLRAVVRSDIRDKDRLIVYLAAHGVMRGKEAHLRFEPDDVVPVSEVLNELKGLAAGTKLLILDAGQDSYNPRSGISFSAFPAALHHEIVAANDPTLWVLCANSSFERSHVSPNAGGRSVFGRFVSEALAGYADEDGDRVIRLDELYAYVQPNVSEWVSAATGKNESQTPLLLNCRGSDESSAAIDLLSISALPSVEELEASEDASEPQLDLRSAVSEAAASHVPPQTSAAVAQRGGEGSAGSSTDASQSGNAADGEKPAGANASRERSKTTTSRDGLRFREQALEELAKAWTAVAELESTGQTPKPSAYAPSVWRALVDRLLWYESFCAADFPSNNDAIWRSAIAELQSINHSFENFDSGENIPANGNQVDELRLACSRLLPPMPLEQTPGQHFSLAQLEYAAKLHGNRPLPEIVGKIIKFGSEYDALVLKAEDSTPAKLNEFLTAKAEELKVFANFYELQILDLRNRPNVPWHLTKMALRARRLGEQVAANLLCGEGWARAAIETGDRLRLEGERLVRDQTDQNWEQIARDSLIEALNQYARATEELQAVRNIIDARSELLSRLPDYFRWAHIGRADSSENSPKTEDLEKVISLLADVDKVLSQPGNERVDQLTNLSARLGEARESLDLGLKAPNDPWRIESVLRTALPPYRSRRQIRIDLMREGKDDTSAFTRRPPNSAAFQALPLDDHRWSAEKDEIEAELELARRAGFNPESVELPLSLAGTNSADAAKVLAIGRHYNDLFAASSDASFNAEGLTDSENRPDALLGLRGHTRNWLLQGAAEESGRNSPVADLFSLLNRAAWYDLLIWQSARAQRALADASLAEVRSLPLLRDTYRKLAATIPGQPKLDSIAKGQLTLDAEDQIYLVRQDQERMRLRIESPSATDIWLIAEYDSRVLSVEGEGIVRQEDLRAEAARKNRMPSSSQRAMYPYRPDVLGAPTTALSPNVPRDVELVVRRLSSEHGDTKLILKAVSRDAYLRRVVAVGLPGKESFHLAVDALSGLWSEKNGGIVLHPLPNQENQFAFLLSNRANVKKTVSVSFIAPERLPSGGQADAMPRGAPALAEADEILAQYGGKPLIPSLTVELPASGEAVRVKFTPPADQKPQANLLPTDPANPDKPPEIDLPYGLIVVIEDSAEQRKTLRRVLIEPQPPRHYLSAIAEIDAAGNLTITVSATNEAVVPPQGIHISAKIDGISEQFDHKLEGDITAPTFTTRLTGRLAANAPDVLTATIDVAGYPRAFIFQIERGADSSSIPPATNTMEVRIASPQWHQAFKAPQAVVPVKLEVDAPHDTFSAGSNAQVEVGIDSDRDRELSNETDPTWKLRSDRQVSVAAKSFAPDGTLTLDTRISDFSLNLTSNKNGLAYVLGELSAPQLRRRASSEPIEIKLDGSPPDIEQIRLSGNQIEAGKDLDIVVFVNDLSRVVSVEATFETPAGGNATEETAGTAAQSGDGLRWVTKLKTDKLFPGIQHVVVVWAKDEVGHESRRRSDGVLVVKPKVEQKLTPEQVRLRKSTSVRGRVLYKREPLADAVVRFDPPLSPPIAPVTTDSTGQFEFRNVPPGKHKLRARGEGNGYPRHAQMEIEVPEAPKKLDGVTLEVK